MTDEPTLFTKQPRDQPKARARKERVLSAHETMKARYITMARVALLEAALERPSLRASGDDVAERVPWPDSLSRTALGAVPSRLANAKIIERSGYVSSDRANQHGTMISEWRIIDVAKAREFITNNKENT